MPVCLRCGYDLRATPVEAPCPECGLAAHRSVIEHSHPDDCPPGWVGMIAAASVMLLISYVGFGLLLAWMLAGDESIVFGFDWEIHRYLGQPEIFCGLAALLIVHATANNLLSRDDRKGDRGGTSRVHQWGLRLLPLAPILSLAVIADVNWGHSAGLWIDENDARSLSNWLMGALVLCPPITFFRLKWLAVQLSRPRLAEHVGIVAVGCTASLLLMIACSVVAWQGIAKSDVIFYLMLVLPVALVALFNLWAMLLLFVVSQRFLQSARESRARWRAADASQPGN
jgi:hypothetical protein